MSSGLKNSRIHQEIIGNRAKWVLKPSLLGKGEGIKFGKNYSDSDWYGLVKEAALVKNNIFQEYISQHKFDLTPTSQTDDIRSKVNLVGTLLCLNGKFLGPGV